jgi:hypothetical protein
MDAGSLSPIGIPGFPTVSTHFPNDSRQASPSREQDLVKKRSKDGKYLSLVHFSENGLSVAYIVHADFTPMSRAFLMFTLVAHVLTAEVDVERFFRVEQHLQPNDLDAAPIRSVVTLSPEAAVVAWTVAPGQRLLTHRHPRGQDTCAAPLLSRSYVLLTNINCPSMTGGQCSRVGASTLSMRRAQRVPSKQVTLSSLGRAMCMAC